VGTDGGLLLERDRELEQIRRHLQWALDSQGSVLIVEGPAGIGKTAMLTAARDAAKSEGFRVLRARGAQLEGEYAFGIVRQLVEPLLAETPDAERALLMDGPPGLAARLLDIPGAHDAIITDFPVAPDPGFAVLHGLYWLFANLAAERPVALVVDDVHWADRASLRFLAFLLPRLEELRAVVLLAARPAEAGASRELMAAVTMDPATEVITLRPLTTGGVARLVAAGLGSEPEPGFVAACWDATADRRFWSARSSQRCGRRESLRSRPRPRESTLSRPPPWAAGR
jgi:predicted ATPase